MIITESLKNRAIVLSLTVLCFLSGGGAWAADQKEWELCPHFLVRGPEKISFSTTETVLLCGDPDSEAWRNIPASQAEFHLRAMLQDRGFYGAKVVREGDNLVAILGNPTYTRNVTLVGKVPGINLDEFRRLKNQRLTPGFLREVEERFTFELKDLGFSCGKTKTTAEAQSGDLTITLEPGSRSLLTEVKIEETEHLHPRILERFHAFSVGRYLHGEAVPLTVQRTISNGIIQNTYFESACSDAGTVLSQSVSPGAPRVVTLGVGLNTEKGLVAKASWKHTRLGPLGSNVDFSLRASFRDGQRNKQDFTATSEWYYLSEPSRNFIRPTLNVGREAHANYEILHTRFELLPTWKWDSGHEGFLFNVGPSITGVKTIRGVGPAESYYTSLGAEFDWMSHEFELYRTSPRGGFNLNVRGTTSSPKFLSDLSAHSLAIRAKYLWNLGNYKPALFVLGVRAGLTATATAEGSVAQLPATLRNYLGGEGDLRGFSLQELPGPQGAGTALSLGVELRVANFLPWGLEPYVFSDFGKLGTDAFQLDSPLFLSPGLGMRFESMIGVFRVSVAHGLMSETNAAFPSSLQHWQFYFSYGEEF